MRLTQVRCSVPYPREIYPTFFLLQGLENLSYFREPRGFTRKYAHQIPAASSRDL